MQVRESLDIPMFRLIVPIHKSTEAVIISLCLMNRLYMSGENK